MAYGIRRNPGTATDVQLLPQLHLYLSHHRDCDESSRYGRQPCDAVCPGLVGQIQGVQFRIGLQGG